MLTNPSQIRVRIAPSPTGEPILGLDILLFLTIFFLKIKKASLFYELRILIEKDIKAQVRLIFLNP